MQGFKNSLKMLLLTFCACFNAFADTASQTDTTYLPGSSMAVNQPVLFSAAPRDRLLKNQGKLAKYRFALVFTPEDLSTEPYKNMMPVSFDRQLYAAESTQRIVGFFIQSYF